MKLIFEKGAEGRRLSLLPACDVPKTQLSAERKRELRLPQLSENELSRHYTALSKRAHGVNDGFYPLGSCTMKYNPKVNDEAAGLPGFTDIHPLQPAYTVQGALEVLNLAEKVFCEITGMDAMSFEPAAGAHGEFTGLLLIKAYHEKRGEKKRTKIIVPDSAHGTNPASAAMAGYEVVSIASRPDGCVDLDALRAAVGGDTAGLMLTNPNTVGLFDRNILEITKIVHEAGGLCYYDGANLNAVMGIVRPGDMGFDVIHLNLHKTFSTPHGGGGPGSGPCGCKALLAEFLPGEQTRRIGDGATSGSCQTSTDRNRTGVCVETNETACGAGNNCETGAAYTFYKPAESIGRVKMFHGNFLVLVRALCYALTLGKEGIPEAAENAVLNANYLKHLLADDYDMAFDGLCMHEFVMTLEKLKNELDVSALDIAKALLDYGIHPPTMYFPLIVHEALMIEPTETESKEELEQAAEVFRQILKDAKANPQALHEAPRTTPVRRLDEVTAARKPVLRYTFETAE